MIAKVRPDEWHDMSWERVLLDVRTPGEFAKGHLPGARNLPLFTDEERAEVGTLYKQQSPDLAYLRGLEFAGQRMRWYVEEARRLAPGRRVVIHCWRGGERSASIAWLLEKAGFDLMQLEGGYKAMRRFYRQYLEWWDEPLITLGGYTGSGKTHILQALKAKGERIIDLEGIAQHKGSAFGGLGEAEQQLSTEQFENNLFAAVIAMSQRSGPIWIENESRTIGKVYLPDELWGKMQETTLVHLEIPLEKRVQNLVKDYADFPDQALIDSFARIHKRLGGQHVQTAIAAIKEQDYPSAAAIALRYYDKTYSYFLENWPTERKVILQPDSCEVADLADLLQEWRTAEWDQMITK